METSMGPALPVAVIGAGPIGLAAAAHLVSRGEAPVVLEAGEGAGSAIRGWAHVRLFSPWRYLVDGVTRGMLEAEGWEMPDGELAPTGGELVAEYLEPLAGHARIAPHVRYGSRVESVTRLGFDKVRSGGREAAPFEVVVKRAGGRVERVLARAVIDASGTYGSPNPLGSGGVAAEGEVELADRIHYGIPDVRGRDRRRYARKRTLVVGSGHSAFNALLDLAALAEEEPETEVIWAVRRRDEGQMYGGGAKDALPARGSLGVRLKALVDSGRIRMVRGFGATRLARTDRGVLVTGGDRVIGPVDEVVVATGFRPDLAVTRELRLGLDPWLEAPVKLAPLIDPNVHSCGTVYPHGAAELSHPEADFYTVGMKSYGRAPTFLLLTGYEQVRSVVAKLTGDEEGANRVELVLPETGVCSTDLGGSCCGTGDARARAGAAPVVALGSARVGGGACGVAPVAAEGAGAATAEGVGAADSGRVIAVGAPGAAGAAPQGRGAEARRGGGASLPVVGSASGGCC
jgi:thioredoxin reductase